ncbi:EAL domain-containing protein [Colwellia psychrerythraea]|uniref:Diguanylate cyclase/phosphodiesterase n=1 Tax=Colwellia psychrerythraea TaxID=28229 RepID=A0A099KK81_COLPS|nr:GGDEF domain-containing protein [Colwellia psychrerythraea]KGJ89988.1 diguanylate cyclase/phosphodiesterase [Colwellia psychrerythraea]
MYKFSKLFIKNIFFASVFIIALGSIAFFLLSNYVNQQTFAQQKTIQTISQQFIGNDIPEKELVTKLSTILNAQNDYQNLSIKRDSLILFDYQNNYIHPLNSFIEQRKTVSITELDLQVQYQLNFISLIDLLTQLFIGVILLSILFVFISARLNYKLQLTIFSIISKQISNELAQINNSDFITKKQDNQQLLEIPALEEGIAEIKSMMTEQFHNTANLEIEAHVDTLTGIENRNRFVQFYENEIINDSPVNFGVLIITRCSELQTINQVHGYNSGDNYIVKVAEIIKEALFSRPTGKIFRLNSSDFATVLPNTTLKAGEEYANELMLKFNDYQQVNELDSVAYSGLVYFDQSKPLGELLALADTGVSVAQTQKVNSWYSQKDIDILTDATANFGNQNWRQEIDDVLSNGRINLLLQPIQPIGRNNRVYGEVLARFLNANSDMLPTSTFIAMAEKLDKITDVDRLIIDTAIKEITSKNMLDNSYGINISPRSINNQHFMIWLERKLLREPTAASRLVFEISELGLQQNIKTAKRLVDMLHRVGSRVTVERFGVGLTSFKFFRDLTPDYIKMDSSYTRDIDDDKNNQYFLRLMVDLAHRLGISVLAESVESQEEKHTLEKLFIDGCQGYYVGKPAKL